MPYDAVTAAREAAARFISDGRFFHAYIVSGSDAAGREAAARYLAKAAVCSGAEPPCSRCRDCVKAEKGIHPDIAFVEREKDEKELRVDAVRALRRSAAVIPNEAERGVWIIRDADAMNAQAQNAMLKLLEEPPRYAVFILLAGNPELLLPTVRSRCEELRLRPVREGENPGAEKLAALFEAGDRMGLLRELTSLEKSDRAELTELMESLRRLAVSRLRAGAEPGKMALLAGAAGQAEKYLDANVSSGYVTGFLLAQMTGQETKIPPQGGDSREIH